MRSDQSLKDMESLTEGIREELDNAARAEALPDRMAALERTAELSKRLRSKCNRELMDLHRMKEQPKQPNDEQAK